jgi:hypothetical protein
MEPTELMLGEGARRLRLGRLSRHRPDDERRRLPDDRMLWKATATIRFAPFPTINSVLSNAAELRRQSRHVFGVPMENRTPMKTTDGASELPYLNEWCEPPQVGQPRTPQARGPAVAAFKDGSPTEFQRLCETGV